MTKKRTPKFPGRVLYRTVSVRCKIIAERQAYEVQRLLLQFLELFCRPWRKVRRRTTRQLETSHQQRKSDRKYAEDFPLIYMGCDVIRALKSDFAMLKSCEGLAALGKQAPFACCCLSVLRTCSHAVKARCRSDNTGASPIRVLPPVFTEVL